RSLERNGAVHLAAPAGLPRQGRRARCGVLASDGSFRGREDEAGGGIPGHFAREISNRIDDRARQPSGIAPGSAGLGAEVLSSLLIENRLPSILWRQRTLDPIETEVARFRCF